MSAVLRLDRLVGREVYTANNRRLGRLEEFRAARHGEDWIIGEYIVGTAGLLERLGLGVRLILGISRIGGYVVRWDQLDLSDPARPRLRCSVKELRRGYAPARVSVSSSNRVTCSDISSATSPGRARDPPTSAATSCPQEIGGDRRVQAGTQVALGVQPRDDGRGSRQGGRRDGPATHAPQRCRSGARHRARVQRPTPQDSARLQRHLHFDHRRAARRLGDPLDVRGQAERLVEVPGEGDHQIRAIGEVEIDGLPRDTRAAFAICAMVTRASPRLVMSVSAASRIRPAALALDTVSSCRVVFCLDELDTVSSITGNEARHGDRGEHGQIRIQTAGGCSTTATQASAWRSGASPAAGSCAWN